MSDKPVPCHWCRGETRRIFLPVMKHQVQCTGCGAAGPMCWTASEAIAAWNSLARVWRKPYGDDPAPTDGTEFLGLLSNGWRGSVKASRSIPDRPSYSWWQAPGFVPYDPSFPPNYDWPPDQTRLVGWQPLPPPPADGDDA